jgi:divalent metal cation (Fe/Co/Zn/Cd) transporter
MLSIAVLRLRERQPGAMCSHRRSSRTFASLCQDIPFAAARAHNLHMSAEAKTTPPEVLQRVIRIQSLTLVWMTVEAIVSLGASWMARSPALLAFGGDSAVELLSAAVVFWRFYSPSQRDHAEERAARVAAGLLFVLAAFVAAASVLALLGHVEARPSPVGIGLLAVAAVIMPWLSSQKRRLSASTASAALRADAAQSAVCGYLALIALAGLLINAVLKISWADPIAALGLLPLIVYEGWEAAKGKPCCD